MVWRRDATGRISHSLGALIDQVDARWPKRDKSSDGTIGDARHAATKSGHNKDSKGIVRALDITNDPAHGVNAREIAQTLLDSRDARLSYVISNRQMARTYPRAGTTPWKWAPYSGLNDHREHCHVEVVSNDGLADDTRPWTLPAVKPIIPLSPSPSPADQQKPGVQQGIMATYFKDPVVAYADVPKGWNDRPGCALPYRFPPGPRPKVKVTSVRTKQSVICDVIDVGPHNINDPYWLKPGGRPVAESGKTNKAGIDLTPAAAKAIGLNGLEKVDWEFV